MHLLSVRTIGALCLAGALTLACSDNSDDGGPRIPADIILIPNQPKLSQGLTLKLKATVVDASGRAIGGQQVDFSSSDETVLTVDPDGTMHSVGPLGVARVTADLDGLTNTVDVEIVQRIVSVRVLPESLVINIGLSSYLQVVLIDFKGDPAYSPSPVTFTSQNTSLVTVDQYGFVQAGSTTGKTTIRVSVDTFDVDLPVRVGRIPAQIVANPTSVILGPGAAQQLSVTVRDLAGNAIPAPPVTYTSSNPSVFTVSAGGLVTAVAASGSGVVRIRIENLEQDIAVFIGTAVPVTLVHTTNTATSMYKADIGPGGELVVTAPNGGVALRGTLPGFDLSTSMTTGATPIGVALNHAGTRAYVASVGQLSVLDLTSNTTLAPVPLPGGGDKLGVVVSSNDQRAYVGTNSYVYVIDLANNTLIDSIETGQATFMALHPTQQKLYVCEGSVREVDLNTRTVTRTFNGGSVLKDIGVSPDGTELYAADEGSGSLRVFSVATGNLTQTIPIATGAFGLAVSERWIVVAGGGTTSVFDRVSRFPLSTTSVGGTARRPAINSGQTMIVVPNEDGWVDFLQ